MESAYAQALWKMVEGGMTAAKAVRALEVSLNVHGREALLPRIGSAFARIAQRETKRSHIVLTVAREKDIHRARLSAKKYLDGMVAKSARGGSQPKADGPRAQAVGRDLKTQIDDTLIGGWRLEGREKLKDVSYKKALLDFYARGTR